MVNGIGMLFSAGSNFPTTAVLALDMTLISRLTRSGVTWSVEDVDVVSWFEVERRDGRLEPKSNPLNNVL